MKYPFSFWLGLLHELLGVVVAHTKAHNTLVAIDQGVTTLEGLNPATPAAAAADIAAAAVPVVEAAVAQKLGFSTGGTPTLPTPPVSTPFNAPGVP